MDSQTYTPRNKREVIQEFIDSIKDCYQECEGACFHCNDDICQCDNAIIAQELLRLQKTKPHICQHCGHAVTRQVKHKTPYQLLCTEHGHYKRNGDSCESFWETSEMKQFIDDSIALINETSDTES